MLHLNIIVDYFFNGSFYSFLCLLFTILLTNTISIMYAKSRRILLIIARVILLFFRLKYIRNVEFIAKFIAVYLMYGNKCSNKLIC